MRDNLETLPSRAPMRPRFDRRRDARQDHRARTTERRATAYVRREA